VLHRELVLLVVEHQEPLPHLGLLVLLVVQHREQELSLPLVLGVGLLERLLEVLEVQPLQSLC
jgi:hypothetical protein